MSTLTKAQRDEAVAVIRAETEKHDGNASAASRALGISQQLAQRALLTGSIGVGAVRMMATKTGRPIAGVQPEATDGASPPLRASRWQALAAVSPAFALEAALALAGGYADEVLDAAAILLAGTAPDADRARKAIEDAARRSAEYAKIASDAAGHLMDTSAVETRPEKVAPRGKRTSK